MFLPSAITDPHDGSGGTDTCSDERQAGLQHDGVRDHDSAEDENRRSTVGYDVLDDDV